MNRVKYQEFEQKIALIETLLSKDGAKVKWSEKIPDPDNPTQLRQIDVTIRRGKQLTIVECRLHSQPQSVKWIEELHGRRQSLNAYSAIAVSSSGFTKGAVKKAERFGVILRDFKSLTEEEIRQWGIATGVYIEYVRFFDSFIYIIVNPHIIINILPKDSLLQKHDGTQWPIGNTFKTAADKIYEHDRNFGGFRVQLFTKDLYIGGEKIEEVIFQSNFKKIRKSLKLPTVLTYGDPNEIYCKKLMIQRDSESDFEIYRAKKAAFVIADLSVASPIGRAIFKGIVFDFKKPVSTRGFKLIGQKGNSYTAIPFKLQIVKKDSGFYHSLLSPDSSMLILPA